MREVGRFQRQTPESSGLCVLQVTSWWNVHKEGRDTSRERRDKVNSGERMAVNAKFWDGTKTRGWVRHKCNWERSRTTKCGNKDFRNGISKTFSRKRKAIDRKINLKKKEHAAVPKRKGRRILIQMQTAVDAEIKRLLKRWPYRISR